jgi:hypothetical protein
MPIKDRCFLIERAIREGNELKLASLLRRTDVLETRGIAQTFAGMLRLPLFKPSLLKQQNTKLLESVYLRKWYLLIEPVRSRGRPKSGAVSWRIEQANILKMMISDHVPAAFLQTRIADLLDPPEGSKWKLRFRAVRPGNTRTSLRTVLEGAVVKLKKDQGKLIKQIAYEAGRSERTIRRRKKTVKR